MSTSGYHLQRSLDRASQPQSQSKAWVFKAQYVQPALIQIGLWSPVAERLMIGTAAIESRFIYVRQISGGPGLGYWQMERETHDDLWNRFLRRAQYVGLAKKIQALLNGAAPDVSVCLTNHRYAAAMARVKYLSCSGAIPLSLDGQARYWKSKYNCSPRGRSVEDYKQVWGQLCAAAYPDFA